MGDVFNSCNVSDICWILMCNFRNFGYVEACYTAMSHLCHLDQKVNPMTVQDTKYHFKQLALLPDLLVKDNQLVAPVSSFITQPNITLLYVNTSHVTTSNDSTSVAIVNLPYLILVRCHTCHLVSNTAHPRALLNSSDHTESLT